MKNLPKMKLAFITVLAIASFTSNLALLWTQYSSQAIAGLIEAPNTGTPDNNRIATPGGSRGGACKQTEQQLTALIPEKTTQSLTTSEHPVFWFYIPDVPDDVHSIEFSLHDRNETKTFYRTSVQLTKIPGVIGIPLPPSPKSSLKLNESYHWRFIVRCTPNETPEDDIELDGWVTRVPQTPNLENQVIWHDELTNLANRYLSEPQNTEVKNAWAKLLKSVGLEGLAQVPLISSVSDTNRIQLLGRYTIRFFPPLPERMFF
ncbi:DUF928 domain-containing protein [Coleofasciculus sp. FACHB-64]|uniref:DUF928 domain-containing protein n=1 Tax=Cyanophyceae TaxID=3028117 RepID=UPI0016821B6E|nr:MULTISPECIES: DUF928 domain-containing protein [unclassified Coleofasciculus]MBD1841192.1 DUF928 domain-containing protein [Coleofasciculus sp. FACHB-501]MBD2047760.1 DUF928 domain-containing protein [Coleofasciculus sp. FACHB-64]